MSLSRMSSLKFSSLKKSVPLLLEQLHKYDSIAGNHSLAVNKTALDIARQMKCFSDYEILLLNWGTLLYDVGKLLIPQQILQKTAELTFSEYEIVCRHSQFSHDILKKHGFPQQVLEIALYHHERFDGEGYLYGLKGNDIPIFARICAVADAFNAMISDRPYRKAFSVAEAEAELFWNCGTQFDPTAVQALLRMKPKVVNEGCMYPLSMSLGN